MEPAAGRREHTVLGAPLHRDQVAAMEPTAGRREHRCRYRTGSTRPSCRNGARRRTAGARLASDILSQGAGLPQWSPPSKGGSTDPVLPPHRGGDHAQWSPPPDGGSTRGGHVGRADGRVAAMEPAVDRREHRALLPDDLHGARLAAMEPAGHRREHLAGSGASVSSAPSRNGARR